jgi:hypothetical protein
MLSFTITELQRIIPKLMALQKGWFRHVRRDFERFASLRTKKIGTWPDLTSPWVTKCPNMLLCFIFLLFSTSWETSHSTLFLLFKWTRLRIWTPQAFGLGSSQRGLLYSGRLCLWPWRTYPLHNIETPYGMHTHEVVVTNLR